MVLVPNADFQNLRILTGVSPVNVVAIRSACHIRAHNVRSVVFFFACFASRMPFARFIPCVVDDWFARDFENTLGTELDSVSIFRIKMSVDRLATDRGMETRAFIAMPQTQSLQYSLYCHPRVSTTERGEDMRRACVDLIHEDILVGFELALGGRRADEL